jgi:hypothetical protein
VLENLNNKKFGQPDSTVIFNLPYFRRKVNPNGKKTEILKRNYLDFGKLKSNPTVA